MSDKVTNIEVAKELGRILLGLGVTIGKVVAVMGFLSVCVILAALLAVTIGPYIMAVSQSATHIIGLAPDIAWTILKLIVNVIGLIFWLTIFWALWEKAREKAEKRASEE